MAVARSEGVTDREVEDAARILDGRVRETPLLSSGELSRRLGAPVGLKAENLQFTGSFKSRGAFNLISRLPDEQLRCGVVAASAGNHAQAVAFAAREAGAGAVLAMPASAPLGNVAAGRARGPAAVLAVPASAPLVKVAAVRRYGGEVRLVEGSYEDAGEEAKRIAAEEGRTLVHAFDDPAIVAGQGTVGLEIARQNPDVRLAVVPMGGGGLVSGIAIALKSRLPDARVVAVQAAARTRGTICDGIAVKRPGELTGPLVDRYVDEVVTVSDDQVAEAMVLLLERSKLVVEGAGAVGVAALMHGLIEPPAAGEVCAVLSGGNVDAALLSEAIRLGETHAGRRMVLSTVVPDRPGALAALLSLVAARGANVVDVEHLRDGLELHVRETAIKLVLETRGPDHSREVVEAARAEGFSVRVEREA